MLLLETPLSMNDMHLPFGKPLARACLKSECSDFQVRESLDFEPEGEGDHHYLYLEKQGVNTAFLVKQLMDELAVSEVDIGYAGRKDRHGVTAQWFSIHSPRSYDWSSHIDNIHLRLQALSDGKESVRLCEATRHSKKLRKGQIAENHFTIVLRDLDPGRDKIEAAFASRVEQIVHHGFANYFGDQRLHAIRRILDESTHLATHTHALSASDMDRLLTEHFSKKLKRRRRGRKGFDLSVVRSFLFNLMLNERLRHSDDLFVEKRSSKESDDLNALIPLFGESREHEWLETEFAETLQHFPELMAMIERQRTQVGWRTAWADVRRWQHQWLDETSVKARFSLPKGSYATVLLAQLVMLHEPDRQAFASP